MKNIFILLIAIPFLVVSQNAQTKFILDSIGNKSDHHTLWNKYPDKAFEVRIAKDTGFVHQMSLTKYETFFSDIKIIKNEIEKITSQKYSDSTIFLIDFIYFNDNCSSNYSNDFNKILYNERKSYLNPRKNEIETKYKNLVFIVLFQNAIKIYNNEKIKPEKEYFFSDSNDYFKKNIFKKSALCGSMCLINSDGKILLRNGEYVIQMMADHLKPEIWNKIFSTINVNEKIEVKE